MKPERLRVTHTVASLRADHGGPARSITALCSALSATDTEVTIVTRASQADQEPPVRPASGVVTTHFVKRRTEDPLGVGQLWAFRDAVRQACSAPDVVAHDHGVWLPTNHATAVAAHAGRVPRVVSPRGMLSEWALAQRRWRKRAAWVLYQHRDLATAQVLHATSEDETTEFRRLGLRQPVAMIPNGVTLPPCRIRPPRPDGRRTALFLSRIHPKKGLLNLVRAWDRVRPADWRLEIVGPDDGGHQADVARLVTAAGLESVVTFSGPVADEAKWDIYEGADLFVLPTYSENFGLVVAEALAAELPVITTTAAPWQCLREHRCGWWIGIGVEPLAAALDAATRLCDDERAAMGRRGRAYVERELSWDRAARDMHELYVWLLRGGPAPATLRTA